jgi:hypothetical protein
MEMLQRLDMSQYVFNLNFTYNLKYHTKILSVDEIRPKLCLFLILLVL